MHRWGDGWTDTREWEDMGMVNVGGMVRSVHVHMHERTIRDEGT